MMGEHAKSEGLFYYFKLADHVPQTHLLRLIDRHVDFGFLRNRLRPLYPRKRTFARQSKKVCL